MESESLVIERVFYENPYGICFVYLVKDRVVYSTFVPKNNYVTGYLESAEWEIGARIAPKLIEYFKLKEGIIVWRTTGMVYDTQNLLDPDPTWKHPVQWKEGT
jgi:hypothetical protein